MTSVITIVDITNEMIERAATALMACEAEGKLTDIYGHVDRKRARRFATDALIAALELRVD